MTTDNAASSMTRREQLKETAPRTDARKSGGHLQTMTDPYRGRKGQSSRGAGHGGKDSGKSAT
jgi:hypothetical protein